MITSAPVTQNLGANSSKVLELTPWIRLFLRQGHKIPNLYGTRVLRLNRAESLPDKL